MRNFVLMSLLLFQVPLWACPQSVAHQAQNVSASSVTLEDLIALTPESVKRGRFRLWELSFQNVEKLALHLPDEEVENIRLYLGIFKDPHAAEQTLKRRFSKTARTSLPLDILENYQFCIAFMSLYDEVHKSDIGIRMSITMLKKITKTDRWAQKNGRVLFTVANYARRFYPDTIWQHFKRELRGTPSEHFLFSAKYKSLNEQEPLID